jgi:monothiol glutaredoxin
MAALEPSASIRQLSALEVKALIDAGETFQFVDVRSDEERAIATIPGTRLLDQAYHDELLTMDRDTPIVFHCHLGVRSQNAALYFQEHGFRNLSNLRKGIDAWSFDVDPSVPRY